MPIGLIQRAEAFPSPTMAAAGKYGCYITVC
ncbi:hypothetical protein SAMN04515668_4731 [Hymenobacter arizonensis]|uniref:Uncharacterized protein n=1 Tax=Hymenobacter arizonensis TaxID=1227077 RepID=A0A1I6BMB8_HYMAR|nr:hypothetical protein SAMN04515668_4731 [Hymenobacter arizonensis]